MKLLGHTVPLCLTFWVAAKQFSEVSEPCYSPISNECSSFSTSLITLFIDLFFINQELLRDCSGALLVCVRFLRLQRAGATFLSLRWLLLWLLGSRAQARSLWHRRLVPSRHVGSSWTRDQTCGSYTSTWIFHHWATREALLPYFWTVNYGPIQNEERKTQGKFAEQITFHVII